MSKNYLLIILSLYLSFCCYSQNSSKAEIYSWYDEQTGVENSTLFRGIEYVEADRMINQKHKFLGVQNFQVGSIIYDGQAYYDIPLKYNIYDDLLLINQQYNQRNLIFQVFRDKVDFFEINGRKFKYLQANNNSNIIGFYEVISEKGDFKIFKKHLKNRKEIRDRNVAYSEFTTANPDYIFQFEDKFFDLDNRRDLFSQFPDFKSEIRSFYSKNRKQSNDNPDVFMKSLANEMNSLISTTTNEIE